jgi:hypothetical protein
MKFEFRFEMNSTGNYVGVLANSVLVKGKIASQNAGSSNGGLYYQVGGLGVNGYFHDALGDATLLDNVNKAMVTAYDNRFGKDAWKQDQNGRGDRLTSFYIPFPADAHSVGVSVGSRVAGMVYSVGPQIPGPKVPDRDLYRQIYVDAFAAVAAANKNAASTETIEALRLTMLSTGIYGPSDATDATALAHDAACVILEAVEVSAKLPDAAHLPGIMLINNSKVAKKLPNKEMDAFSSAAKARGITVDSTGFTLDLAGQTQAKKAHL